MFLNMIIVGQVEQVHMDFVINAKKVCWTDQKEILWHNKSSFHYLWLLEPNQSKKIRRLAIPEHLFDTHEHLFKLFTLDSPLQKLSIIT